MGTDNIDTVAKEAEAEEKQGEAEEADTRNGEDAAETTHQDGAR